MSVGEIFDPVGGEWWVTATCGADRLGPDVTAALVRDWRRRGLVVDERGHDRTRLARGRRWYPLADLQRAEAGTFGRSRPRGVAVLP